MIVWLATAVRWVLANWKLVGVGVIAISATWWHFNATQAAYNRGYKAADDIRVVREAQVASNAQKAKDGAQDQIARIDRTKTQEIENARVEAESLRADLRSAHLRLSVRTIPAAPIPDQAGVCPSVDNGSQRADIDPRDAEAIVAITQRGDEAIRQLMAAQGVIRALTLPDGP